MRVCPGEDLTHAWNKRVRLLEIHVRPAEDQRSRTGNVHVLEGAGRRCFALPATPSPTEEHVFYPVHQEEGVLSDAREEGATVIGGAPEVLHPLEVLVPLRR